MSDTLQITALRILTHIGVHAWEQRILQELRLDIAIAADFSQCGEDLTKTIDYSDICDRVTAFVESNSFILIETVAEKVAALIKDHYPVKQLTISVSKPHAIKNAANICVTIHR